MFACLTALTLVLAAGNLASGQAISKIDAYGNYISGGINVSLGTLNNNETGRAYIKPHNSGSYIEVNPLVRYDASNLATSIFNLSENTSYDVRIDIFDAGGNMVDQGTAAFLTKPEWSLPAAVRTVIVSNDSELNFAASNLQAGDRVLLKPGIYSGFSLSNKRFSESSRAAFTSYDSLDRATIHGQIYVSGSSYLTFYGLNVESASPIGIRGGNYIDLVNNRLTDYLGAPAGEGLITITHSEESPLGKAVGGNLLLGNYIADLDHGQFEIVNGAERQTYYGIKQNYGVGGYTTIRNNVITGVADGISPGGDEGMAPILNENDPNVLATWPNRELDIYNNLIYWLSDDCIETDGHMSNGRIFGNILGRCQNALSFAPLYPGPYFVVRNYITGYLENALKLHTGVEGQTRNILLYQNSIQEGSPGSWTYSAIYRGTPAKSKNIVLRNNIVNSFNRVYGTDIASNYPCEYFHTNHNFDNDLMWSSTLTPGQDTIFKWGFTNHNGIPGEDDSRYFTSFEAFKSWTANPDINYTCPDQLTIPEEPHGIYASPQWDIRRINGLTATDNPAIPGQTNGTYFAVPNSSSPAINAASRLLGINDNYSGSGPDIGAFEVGYDLQAPSIPAGLNAMTIASTRIALKWSPTADNATEGILGYTVYRNSSPVAFTTMDYYLDTGLNSSTRYNYSISAYDTSGNESSKSSSASASTKANTSPTLEAILDQNIYEGQTLDLQLSALDPDIDDAIHYSVSGATQGSIFDENTGAFSWTPSYSAAGAYNLVFSASDGKGGTASQNITITVKAVNELNLARVKLQYGQPVPKLGIINYTGAKDTSLFDNSENASYYERGSATNMQYRYKDDTGLYWFDLSGIPSGAKIIDSRISLYSISSDFDQAGDIPIYLAKTLPPNDGIIWVEGSGVNYYDQYHGTSWARKDNIAGSKPRYAWSGLPGRFSSGDLASTYSGTAVGKIHFAKAAGDYNSTNIAQAITDIRAQNGKYEGFVLEMYSATTGTRKDSTATKEYANASKRPALYITYEIQIANCYDLTGDKKVNVFDLVFVAIRLGNPAGDPADVAGNNGVNIQDLQEVAKYLGQTC
ncbi:MAG: putative Ig domain-containing protein [Candidatus Diapherotrites archaeon]|nr:putative Ig domain-containing protein [Candidatus Diapherotrites archaeon]